MQAIVTQSRIARHLGMPRATVAAALNPRLAGRLRPELRQRVHDAAQRLGYTPNQAARSLKLGKTHVITLATNESLVHSYVHEMVEEVRGSLASHGYRMLLELLTGEEDMIALVGGSVRATSDGVVLLGSAPYVGALMERLGNQPPQMPHVFVSGDTHPKANCVSLDRAKAIELGTAHLLERGHRRVALVYGVEDTAVGRQRMEGYRSALRKAGLPFQNELVLRSPVLDCDPTALCAQLLGLQPRPTAVFCWNDEIALRLSQALHRAGVRIPEDMALATLNNSHLTTVAEVPLTAVDFNNRGRARAAVELLMEQLRQPATPARQISVEPFLVERESSKKKG